MSKNYVTVGMYRIPYSTRTLALDGKTRFRARLTKEVDPSTGKRKEVEILALSLEELVEKLELQIHPYGFLVNRDHARILFRELAEKWFKAGLPVWEPSTSAKYRHALDVVVSIVKDRKLKEMTHNYMQNLINKLISDPTMTDSAIRDVKFILYVVLEHAVQNKYTITNPAKGLKAPKKIFSPQISLSVEQQNTLLKAFEKRPVYEAIVAVSLGGGGRIHETLALTWDKFDENNKTLRFDCSLLWKKQGKEKTPYLRTHNKNRVSRTVFLPDFAVEYLKKHRELQKSIKKRESENWHETIPNLIFTDSSGNPVRYNDFCRYYKNTVNKLDDGMKDIHIHTLRHTAASNVYHHSGKNIIAVQEFLGHLCIENTLIYTHSRPEDRKDVATAIDNEFRRV